MKQMEAVLATPPASLKPVDELDGSQLRQLQQETAGYFGVPVFFNDHLKNGSAGPALAVIPGGRFEMGSDPDEHGHQKNEAPRHLTLISEAFAIGVYPITAEEFEQFRRDTEWTLRRELIWHEGRYPVINVRMEDVKLYLEWLTEQTGEQYRLPTEAEWEYATRAGTVTPFHYGDDVSCREVHFNPFFPYRESQEKRRWYLPRCFPSPKASEVGLLSPNLWGLHDVHGNVWEFTGSHWSNSHLNANRDGSQSIASDPYWYVTKGGSWFDPASKARSAARKKRYLDEMDTNLGFRVVRELRHPR